MMLHIVRTCRAEVSDGVKAQIESEVVLLQRSNGFLNG